MRTKSRASSTGKAPFYEPGLAELIEEGRANGRLTATTLLEPAIEQADIALICVGTPSERNGNLGLDQLRRVCSQIATAWQGQDRRLIVAVRSTVFPGTCEELTAACLGGPDRFAVVSNPEFLREGNAVNDFLEPSLLVVGGLDRCAVETVAELYRSLAGGSLPGLAAHGGDDQVRLQYLPCPESRLCQRDGRAQRSVGYPGAEVMDTMCRDTKLNISPAYLKPGFAFGGSCLPKDLRALVFRAWRLDVKLPLLESVLPSNDEHLKRAIQKVMDLPAARIGVFGLAFKENTDDLRESPVVALFEHLIGKGAPGSGLTIRISGWRKSTAAISDSCWPPSRTSPICLNRIWSACWNGPAISSSRSGPRRPPPR